MKWGDNYIKNTYGRHSVLRRKRDNILIREYLAGETSKRIRESLQIGLIEL